MQLHFKIIAFPFFYKCTTPTPRKQSEMQINKWCLGAAKIYVQLLKHRVVKNVATKIEKTEAISNTPVDFL